MPEFVADIRAAAYMKNNLIETILKKYYAHTAKGYRNEQRKWCKTLLLVQVTQVLRRLIPQSGSVVLP